MEYHSVASVKHLYEIAERNGWYLPALKSNFVNMLYLEWVRSGLIYCPRYEELRLRPCPVPPSKDKIL